MMPFDAGTFDDGIVITHGHGGITSNATRVESVIVPNILNGDFLRLREAANH